MGNDIKEALEAVATGEVKGSIKSTPSADAQQMLNAVSGEQNPMSVLNERQRIALAGKWSKLKEGERDQYAEYIAAGITDAATLYVIATILTDANNKIFSDARAEYLGTLIQWYQALTSSEASIKKFGEQELQKLANKCTGAQLSQLLSALKAKLLANRTFLPEPVEKSFRALCRFYGFDLNMVK